MEHAPVHCDCCGTEIRGRYYVYRDTGIGICLACQALAREPARMDRAMDAESGPVGPFSGSLFDALIPASHGPGRDIESIREAIEESFGPDPEERHLLTFALQFPLIRNAAELTEVPALLADGNEFCSALTWAPAFIDAVCREGFFPMANGYYDRPFLLVKHHNFRCVLFTERLHVSRRVRQRAPGYALSANTAFVECLARIREQHGEDWLVAPLAEAFQELHANRDNGRFKSKFTSIELRNKRGELVAGEIGFANGECYTSLSGFFLENGAGAVLLCALGARLAKLGFRLWDLGMFAPYKRDLGAVLIPGTVWLAEYRRAREAAEISLSFPETNAREIITDAV